MRMPFTSSTRRPNSRLGGVSLVRVRLWLAMLGLAALPMLGVIFIVDTFTPEEPAAATDRRGWQTSVAVADLSAREQAVEQRVLGVAADPEVLDLVDGISGTTERESASRVLASIEGSEPGLVSGACITRSLDSSRVNLLPSASSNSAAASPSSPARCA